MPSGDLEMTLLSQLEHRETQPGQPVYYGTIYQKLSEKEERKKKQKKEGRIKDREGGRSRTGLGRASMLN